MNTPEAEAALAKGVHDAFSSLRAAMAPTAYDTETDHVDGLQDGLRDVLREAMRCTDPGTPSRVVDLTRETGNSAAQYVEPGESEDWECRKTHVRVLWTNVGLGEPKQGPPVWFDVKVGVEGFAVRLHWSHSQWIRGTGHVHTYTTEVIAA